MVNRTYCRLKIWLVLFVFSCHFQMFAQNSVDYSIFMDYVQEQSVLFRGELALNYGNRMPNDGSIFFAYSTDFENGEVLFRGKRYKDIRLNLNAHLDELYVQEPVQGIRLLVNKNFVDSFSMGKHRFVHCRQGNHPGLIDGYYEVLLSGHLSLYKKIHKKFQESIKSGTKMMLRSYILQESYYLLKDDKWVQVSSKSDLKRVFGAEKRVINEISKTKHLDFRRNKEGSLIELLNVLSFLDVSL